MAKKKKGKSLSLNFKDVKVIKTPAEGTYLVKVVEAELTTSSNDNEMIKWEFEIVGGKYDGNKLWYNTMTGADSLWKLREVLEALGQDVPDGKLDLDLESLVDCECGVSLLHEEYEGKKRAKIADFLAADEVDASDDEDSDEEADDEEEDEEDTKKSKSKSSKKSKAQDDDEADDEDEDSEDEEDEDAEEVDVDSMDEDELEELVKDKDLDVDLDDYSSIKKKRKAVQEALDAAGEDDEDSEDEEDEDSDDEESDETKYSEEQVNKMSQEELEELNDDLSLGIKDLDDMTKKTARRNVIKALKKKGLLED